MKKSIVLCLALIVSLFAVTGSIAYFTDSVTANENVVASGNLDIEQFELERNNETGKLQLYTQNQAIYPAVGKESHPENAQEYTFSTTVIKDGKEETVTGEFSAKLMDTTKLRGFVDKIVVVKNFGSLPVYVRTFVAVPSVFDEAIVLDWNTAGNWTTAEKILPTTDEEKIIIDKQEYTIWYTTCQTKVEPNASAAPSLLGFHLKPDFKNTDSNAELRILVATEASQVLNNGELTGNPTLRSADESMTATYQSAPSASRHPWAE